jgi:hypothetical protein
MSTSRGVDDLEGVGRRDIGGDRGDLAVRDRDVANRADVVPPVDDVSAFQEEVVLLLRRDIDQRQHHATRSRRAPQCHSHVRPFLPVQPILPRHPRR